MRGVLNNVSPLGKWTLTSSATIATALLLSACGGNGSPVSPVTATTTVKAAASALPSASTVEPFPNTPTAGSGCGSPYPPALNRLGVPIPSRNGEGWTLNATPLVADPAYCGLIGYRDGRTLCPVRTPGADDRRACENWRVGHARDTGRPGPTWTREDGRYCTGRASGCENLPADQYELIVYDNGAGLYHVCADNGICGEVIVGR